MVVRKRVGSGEGEMGEGGALGKKAVETTVVETAAGAEAKGPGAEPAETKTRAGEEDSEEGWAEAAEAEAERLDERYPRELRKAAVAGAYLAVALLANAVTLAINHDLVGREPLPDLVHMLVPQWDWAFRVGDYLVAGAVGLNALNLAFHRHRWVVLRRVAGVLAVIFLFRDVMMTVTGMPPGFWDSAAQCQAASNATDWALIWARVWEQLTKAGLQDGVGTGYLCGDMMFSGHTAFLSVGVLGLVTYGPWWLSWARPLLVLLAGVGIASMVVSRAHYTIDIVVSYWISSGFWSIYHAFVEVPLASRHRSSFRRMWWFWAMYWLEEGCPSGALPSRVHWPLPWPAAAHRLARRLNRQRFRRQHRRRRRALDDHSLPTAQDLP